MKYLIILLATLIICQPLAFASDFDNLCAERDQIFSKVMGGNASDSEVQRFQDLVQQINNITTTEFLNRTTQINVLYSSLQHQAAQRDKVAKALFGGSNGGSFNGSLPSGSNNGNFSNFDAPSTSVLPNGQVAGRVSYESPLSNQIDSLVKVALLNPTDADLAVDKYNKPIQKVLAFTKEGINLMIPYRGFGPSSEAADVILGEKLKLKSLQAALYAQQKHMDEVHLKITTQVLQLAQSIGEGDLTAQEIAYKELVNLASKEEADKTKAILDSHLQDQAALPENYNIVDSKQRYSDLLKSALERDPVVKTLQEKLHTFNHHSGAASVAQKVVPALLSIVAMAPNFASPGAKVILGAWIMSTQGGAMESVMLREIYLSERLLSRSALLSDEINMEILAYQKSQGNGPLQFASESLLHQ